MSAIATPLIGQPGAWILPYRGKVAMACLIVAESAIFTIFVVAYLYYLGKSALWADSAQVLETPIFYTVCLLSQQLHDPPCGKAAGTRPARPVPGLVAVDRRSGRPVPVSAPARNGTG